DRVWPPPERRRIDRGVLIAVIKRVRRGLADPPAERSKPVGAPMFGEKLHVAIVGLGPRGLSVAERLCANAESLLPRGRELVIHLVDPHVFDGGQVWRSTQDRVLLMNTVACQVTMF